jgi:hypothetical protein
MNLRQQVRWLFAFAAMAAIQSAATAQTPPHTVLLSLNLEFNTPGDLASGGTWTTVAKTDSAGIAGVSMYLENTNFGSFLAPSDFDVQLQTASGGPRNIVIGVGNALFTPPYPYPLGIGLIGSSYSSTYVDPVGLTTFGCYSDLGSFTGGVALATGTFDPGTIPNWTMTPTPVPVPPPPVSGANVFTGPHPAPILRADTQVSVVTELTVRLVAAPVPEPTALGLAALGAIGFMAIIRQRGRRSPSR